MNRVWLTSVTIFCISGVCQARIITVDPNGSTDHATIQAAIDAAHAGDTVTVRAGTYVENITLKRGVPIVGAGFKETTIDGGGKGPVVTAENVDSTAELEGFTITNGSAENGGGIRCIRSSPTIAHCIFTRNRAFGFGGGMYNQNSSPTLSHCTFSENSAVQASSGGGGVYNVNDSSPILTDCSFENDRARLGFGGALANVGNSRPKLSNVTFSANEAVRGGAIRNESGSDPNLQGTTFSANQAKSHGGAIDNLNSNPRIAGCVFSANTAFYGGAIFNDNSSPEVVGCTFSANGAGSTGAAALHVLKGPLWLTFAIVFLVAVWGLGKFFARPSK